MFFIQLNGLGGSKICKALLSNLITEINLYFITKISVPTFAAGSMLIANAVIATAMPATKVTPAVSVDQPPQVRLR